MYHIFCVNKIMTENLFCNLHFVVINKNDSMTAIYIKGAKACKVLNIVQCLVILVCRSRYLAIRYHGNMAI